VNTYLAVPESETIFTDNETITYANTMKAAFFYYFHTYDIYKLTTLITMSPYGTTYNIIDGLKITFTPTSTTAQDHS